MDAQERRTQIVNILQMDAKPVSATSLADRFRVSRQIIVGDVALLRASGADIVATPRGYILNKAAEEGPDPADSYVLVCRHDKSQLEAELLTIIDNGARFTNISVEHPIYGTIVQPLELRSRYDVDKFLNKIAVTGAQLLSSLTDGVHLHTIRCPDPEAYRRILVELKEKGVLYTK